MQERRLLPLNHGPWILTWTRLADCPRPDMPTVQESHNENSTQTRGAAGDCHYRGD